METRGGGGYEGMGGEGISEMLGWFFCVFSCVKTYSGSLVKKGIQLAQNSPLQYPSLPTP